MKDTKEIGARGPNLGGLVADGTANHLKKGTKLDWHNANCENMEHSIESYDAQNLIINLSGLPLQGNLNRVLTHPMKPHLPGLSWKIVSAKLEHMLSPNMC